MLVQLIYISTPNPDGRNAVINDVAKYYEKNKSLGINSVLLATNEFFLQAFEGRRDVVNDMYNKIINDPNHSDVNILRYQEIRKEEFSNCHLVFLGDDYTGLEFLNDVAPISDLNYANMSSAIAMSLLRRSLAIIQCLTYPNRRKTDIAEIPELPLKLRANS